MVQWNFITETVANLLILYIYCFPFFLCVWELGFLLFGRKVCLLNPSWKVLGFWFLLGFFIWIWWAKASYLHGMGYSWAINLNLVILRHPPVFPSFSCSYDRLRNKEVDVDLFTRIKNCIINWWLDVFFKLKLRLSHIFSH